MRHSKQAPYLYILSLQLLEQLRLFLKASESSKYYLQNGLIDSSSLRPGKEFPAVVVMNISIQYIKQRGVRSFLSGYLSSILSITITIGINVLACLNYEVKFSFFSSEGASFNQCYRSKISYLKNELFPCLKEHCRSP